MVLATEKKQKSILYDERSVHKVEPITKHIGLVYSGMGPDYRYFILFIVFLTISRIDCNLYFQEKNQGCFPLIFQFLFFGVLCLAIAASLRAEFSLPV